MHFVLHQTLHQSQATLAVWWLGLCWSGMSPETIAASARASLLLDVSGSETAAEQFERGFVYGTEPFGFAEGFKLSFGAKRCADHELFAVRSVQFFGGKIGHCCMAMVGDLHKLTRENSGGRW